MTYANFEQDLQEIYKAEVMGECLYSTTPALSLSRTQKQKWLMLTSLESQTKMRFLDYCAKKYRQNYRMPADRIKTTHENSYRDI